MLIKISRFPPRPTEDEQTSYYKGIGDRPPRLIARTSKSVWPPTSTDDCGVPDKWIDSVADDELVDKWTVDLEATLRQTLKTCDWAFFVPLRIRYNNDGLTTKEEHKGEVVLIVGLWEPMEWREAVSYARLCRAHMYSQGIDIHVEMAHVGEGGPQSFYRIDAGLEKLCLQSGTANSRSISDEEVDDCPAGVELHKRRGLQATEKTSKSVDEFTNEIQAVCRMDTIGSYDVCGRAEVVIMMNKQ